MDVFSSTADDPFCCGRSALRKSNKIAPKLAAKIQRRQVFAALTTFQTPGSVSHAVPCRNEFLSPVIARNVVKAAVTRSGALRKSNKIAPKLAAKIQGRQVFAAFDDVPDARLRLARCALPKRIPVTSNRS